MKLAEEIIEVLKLLKSATTMMSTATSLSASMILPTKTTVLMAVQPNDEDSSTVRDTKEAIRENLDGRYPDMDTQDFLNKCTALDPRFKSLFSSRQEVCCG